MQCFTNDIGADPVAGRRPRQVCKDLSQPRLDLMPKGRGNAVQGCVLADNPPLTIRPAYLVLSTKPSFKPLKQQFDRVLWQILVDGTYRKLCQHYLPKCGTPDVAQAAKAH